MKIVSFKVAKAIKNIDPFMKDAKLNEIESKKTIGI